MCINARETVLKPHIDAYAKNAKYTSKTAQNELLHCVKEYIWEIIVQEIKQQPIDPFYGIQADEVSECNHEQLGLVLRYTCTTLLQLKG